MSVVKPPARNEPTFESIPPILDSPSTRFELLICSLADLNASDIFCFISSAPSPTFLKPSNDLSRPTNQSPIAAATSNMTCAKPLRIAPNGDAAPNRLENALAAISTTANNPAKTLLSFAAFSSLSLKL